jgi:hypothetical protein
MPETGGITTGSAGREPADPVAGSSIWRSWKWTLLRAHACQEVGNLLVPSAMSHGGVSPRLALRCSINRRSFKGTCLFVG